jgi:hypothetical protein
LYSLGIDRIFGLLIVAIGFAKAYPIVPQQTLASGNSSLPLGSEISANVAVFNEAIWIAFSLGT